MTDSWLRILERRYKETGSVEDETAWLLERVRAGDLEKSMLELVAYCGHNAARSALGKDAPKMIDHLSYWASGSGGMGAKGLVSWGKSACVRIAVASSQLVLRIFEERYPDSRQAREAIQAAINWVNCPCETHQAAAERAHEAAFTLSQGINPAHFQEETLPERFARHAAYDALNSASEAASAAAAQRTEGKQLPPRIVGLQTSRGDYIFGAADSAGATAADASGALLNMKCLSETTCRELGIDFGSELRISARIILDEICESIAPWALGDHDPLMRNPLATSYLRSRMRTTAAETG